MMFLAKVLHPEFCLYTLDLADSSRAQRSKFWRKFEKTPCYKMGFKICFDFEVSGCWYFWEIFKTLEMSQQNLGLIGDDRFGSKSPQNLGSIGDDLDRNHLLESSQATMAWRTGQAGSRGGQDGLPASPHCRIGYARVAGGCVFAPFALFSAVMFPCVFRCVRSLDFLECT